MIFQSPRTILCGFKQNRNHKGDAIMADKNKTSRIFGLPKWIAIPLIIIGVLAIFVQCSINHNTRQIEKTKARNQTTQNNRQAPTKTVRRTECERTNSVAYCSCTINHIKKNVGYAERHAWLDGYSLTSAKGRKAATEALIHCRGL